MTEFEKTGLEIVKFMRGKYRLDEVVGMYYEILYKIPSGEEDNLITIFAFTEELEVMDAELSTLSCGCTIQTCGNGFHIQN